MPAAALLVVAAVVAVLVWRGWNTYSYKENSPVPGVTDTTVTVGSSLALGGHAAFLGTETLRGAQAYLNFVNDHEGVNGRTIRLIAYDDGYDPPRTLANTLHLVRTDRVFALFSYVGTPTTIEALPLIQEARVPLVGIFSGAQRLRSPFQPYVVNIRGSYYQETDMMVRHLVEDLGMRRIAVFYQYDSYGLDGLAGSELALAHYGLKPVATGSYMRGTMQVEPGLERIHRSRAQAVIMIGTYDPCAQFIKLAHERGFRPVFLNVSFVGPEQLAGRLGREGEGVLVTQVVPPPTETMLLAGAREYVAALARYFPGQRPTFVGFEGYLNARVLVEGLERAGRHLTREGFLRAIESMRDFSLGIANPLTYGPRDHEGLRDVYLTVIKDGRFLPIISGRVLRQELEGSSRRTTPQEPQAAPREAAR